MTMINIEGLDTAVLQFNLFNNAKPVKNGQVDPLKTQQAYAWMTFNPGKITREQGRIMGAINLGFTRETRRGEFNPALYDSDNGKDAAQRIIGSVRLLTESLTH